MDTPHAPDLVLVNGAITTLASDGVTPPEVAAIAIRHGRVVWTGDSDAASEFVGPATQVIDLGGRRVIPGIVDAHVHFVRAGLTWKDEVRWGTTTSLEQGLAQIADRARSTPAGSWIRVMGGWHPSQFPEGRGPTQEELDAVAPDHPVLVQFLYEWGLLNTVGRELIDWRTADEFGVDPSTIDTDESGDPVGVVRTSPSLRWLQSQLTFPDLDGQVDSTATAATEFLSLGVTGLIDGGGANTGPDKYDAVYEAWRQGRLPLRVRTTVHTSKAGDEEQDIAGFLRYSHARQGDEFLRVLGIGETILYPTHDDFGRPAQLTPENRDRLRWVFDLCARRRWTVQMHMMRPDTLDAVLPMWQEAHAEHGIADLRWAIVHGTGLTSRHVPVLRELGVGVITEALLRLSGDDALEYWSADDLAFAPPIHELRAAGVPVAVGSDGLRVSNYNPFATLQWLVTGHALSGRRIWDEDNVLDRHTALELACAQGPWFSFEDHDRGRIQPGLLADLSVLSEDYFALPPDELPRIRSELTLVGGVARWSGEAFAGALA